MESTCPGMCGSQAQCQCQSHCPIKNRLNIRVKCTSGVDKYPAKAHARRVAEKLKQDEGVIVLSAQRNVNWPNSDMPAPFRQDRYFYYLTGCNEPNCYVTYNIKLDLLTLWLPPVDNDWRHVVYYGNGSTVEEALGKYDIDSARYIRSDKPDELSWETRRLQRLDATISSFWREDRASRTYSPRMIYSRSGFSWQSGVLETDSAPLRAAMNACRVIKDEHEIRLIRRANEITAAAHMNVLRGMHSFDNEAQVEAAYMQTCIANRAKEQAYDPIAGSGPNAAVLHYSSNLANFGRGQTVVLDAGCEFERHASDVTRTIPINKHRPGHWPSPEAENIYKLVEKIQDSCIKQLRPGKSYLEITFHANHLVIDGLLELGILAGDRTKIFHAGTSMAFLPHGLGHHLGLDVHDVSPVPPPPVTQSDDDYFVHSVREAYIAWNPKACSFAKDLTKLENFSLRRDCHSLAVPDTSILEAGMIVTVEPGIYFNDYLLKRFLDDPKQRKFINPNVLKKYIPVGGVRIEDDLLITKDGYENLTTAPKGEAMLKMIQDGASSTD